MKQQQKQQHYHRHQQHQQQQNKNNSNNKYISAITAPISTKLEIRPRQSSVSESRTTTKLKQ